MPLVVTHVIFITNNDGVNDSQLYMVYAKGQAQTLFTQGSNSLNSQAL